MFSFRSVLCSLIVGSFLVACDTESEPTAYCANESALTNQISCVEDSFTFYSRQLESTNDFVTAELVAALEIEDRPGQEKKLERLLEEQSNNFEASMSALMDINAEINDVMTANLELANTAPLNETVLQAETEAQEITREFDEASEKLLKKL
jgi:hypothetical protein